MNLTTQMCRIHDEMIQWRHDFHRHPETGFSEVRTAGKIVDILRSYNMNEVISPVGKTGVIGVLKNGKGPVLALRSDMDALALTDLGMHDHVSMIDRVTHACGHDGHMAMLLGAAKYLSETRNFQGTVLFLFQPAEEFTSGAKAMLATGFLEDYGVQSIFGLHVLPGLEAGIMSISPGIVMAGVDNFDIEIRGKGGHAGAPHLVQDAIVTAASVISGIQTVVSRNSDPIDSVVVSTTGIRSETNLHNVIPGTVTLKGTIRYLNAGKRASIADRIRELATGIASCYGTEANIRIDQQTPPLANSPDLMNVAIDSVNCAIGPHALVQLPPMMGGEDFAFFLEKVPGVFAFIGNGLDSPSLHNGAFDFNDGVLPIGAAYLVGLVHAAQ